MGTLVRIPLFGMLLLMTIYMLPVCAFGLWADNGSPLCTTDGDELMPKIVSDGAGGAIVVWCERQTGRSYGLHAQRVDPSGTVRWALDGVALCALEGGEQFFNLISDGAGGAIVAWKDRRRDREVHIYAQKVNASGVAQWTADGVALCTGAGVQDTPTITSDGEGGAIFAWRYQRRSIGEDIYAQRVNATGAIKWAADGVPLCTAKGSQGKPRIVTDGAAGAIVVWEDMRVGKPHYYGGGSDIYAQRVNASGAVKWAADGVPLCTAGGAQDAPEIVSDGMGGAIVAWRDWREPSQGYKVYAQRVTASGSSKWTVNGAALCTVKGDQQRLAMDSDGAGGAVVAWEDSRKGGPHIYAQRVTGSGAIKWTADGLALCSAFGNKRLPAIASDEMGGAVVAWQDWRDPQSSDDIYVQRVTEQGTVQLAADGMALCTLEGDQTSPTIASDGAGGAIVAWLDLRRGNPDLYAQHVGVGGAAGTVPAR